MGGGPARSGGDLEGVVWRGLEGIRKGSKGRESEGVALCARTTRCDPSTGAAAPAAAEQRTAPAWACSGRPRRKRTPPGGDRTPPADAAPASSRSRPGPAPTHRHQHPTNSLSVASPTTPSGTISRRGPEVVQNVFLAPGPLPDGEQGKRARELGDYTLA
eukprot:8323096-Pyramimonas_sp.AAC.1